ncbi:MAG: 2-dehydropantoate 2-reductase [Kangiellaceae bacterium]|nr:2-dehydropantoate 2-reductase [Kangiellaceae bacterium]
MKSNYPIDIIGAGAIGHLWAGFLMNQNHKINLLTSKQRKPQLITIKSPLLSKQVKIQYVDMDNWRPSTVIIICVKAFQLETVCQQLVKKGLKDATIILMMNGMGLVECVQRNLPECKVLHAYLTHGAYLSEDTLYHTGTGITQLGNLHSDFQFEEFEPLIETLNQALPKVSWNADHQSAMHLKLIINSIINPLTAMHKLKNGQLLNKSGELVKIAELLLNELEPLIPSLVPSLSKEAIKNEIENVAMGTAENRSSMLQDVLKNKPTEIDQINGYLVCLAKKQSVDLAQHIKLINQIKTLQN